MLIHMPKNAVCIHLLQLIVLFVFAHTRTHTHTHGANPQDQGEIQIVTILKANTGDTVHVYF
jgi:hypothetical protein